VVDLRTSIIELPESSAEFQFFWDKQNKIRVAKDIIEKYSQDTQVLFEYESIESRMIIAEEIILLESMILNINVFFDIIGKIIKTECNINIKAILKGKNTKNEFSNIENKVVEYYRCIENQLIRNASNKLKHEGIVQFNYQYGNGISSCFLCPFSTANYISNNYYSTDAIYKISVKLSQKFIEIIELVKEYKTSI